MALILSPNCTLYSARKRPVPYQRAAPSPAWSSSSSTESMKSWRRQSSSCSEHTRRSSSPSISRTPSSSHSFIRYRSRSRYSSPSDSSSFSSASFRSRYGSRRSSPSRSPSVFSCYSVNSTSSHHSSRICHSRSVQI